MFYTGDGNDLIYPRCVPCSKFMDWGTVGAFIYNYTRNCKILRCNAVQTICINLVGKLNKQFRSSGFSNSLNLILKKRKESKKN